jgi:hydrogenase-4 component E
MMQEPATFQELIGAAAMAALWMLGVTRVRSMLWGLGLQGAALGALVLSRGIASGAAGEAVLGAIVVAVKALAIPLFLYWAARRLGVERDKSAGIAPGFAMVLGAALTAACYFESEKFSATGSSSGNAGIAIAIVLIGLIVMMTRRLAIGMLIGFLVLDNGIFAYVVSQTRGMPFVVELGVLFDVFVGVLLAGLVLSRVRKSFEHVDVFEMRELRE